MTTAAFSDVMARLRDLGMTPAQVRALLPAWWEPAVTKTPSGVWETSLLLGRRLGLDAVALAKGQVAQLPGLSPPRFKHTVRVTPSQLGPATMIASSLAKAVIAALPDRPTIRGASAEDVRAQILQTAGARIDFNSLVEFAWKHGIPIIPLPNLPRGIRKMDAAAINVGSRPVIVIARRTDSKAWLSFLLAHELGHVCLGHVPENGSLVEGSITDSAEFDAQSQIDTQEQEANEFAHTLLGGPEADRIIATWGTNLAPVQLAGAAAHASDELACAPGNLLLRYAFRTKRWPEARMALRFHAEDMDAQQALVTRMGRELDTRLVADDLQDFVEAITGIAPQAT